MAPSVAAASRDRVRFAGLARFKGAISPTIVAMRATEAMIAAIMARGALPIGCNQAPDTVCPARWKALRETENGDRTRMEFVLYHLVTVAVIAVALVLIMGLWNLTRGKSPNLSQKLMRWRVGLQFLAIVIIMLFIFVHYR
jgi:hypothetical protein